MSAEGTRVAHSPAPWHWSDTGCDLYPAEDGPIVAVILSDDGCMVKRDCDIEAMRAEIDANKRLIEAAPELLSELKSARNELRILHDDHVYAPDDAHPGDCALCKQIASIDALIDRVEVAP